jgi:hypothetical protein
MNHAGDETSTLEVDAAVDLITKKRFSTGGMVYTGAEMDSAGNVRLNGELNHFSWEAQVDNAENKVKLESDRQRLRKLLLEDPSDAPTVTISTRIVGG